MDPDAFHRSLTVVDGHCDTVLDLVGRSLSRPGGPPRDFLERGSSGHLDLPRLVEGGVACQTMALFVEDALVFDATAETHRLIDALESVFERTGAFVPAKDATGVRTAREAGKVAALLSIEGGECLGESLDELRAFHARGVRMLGLTWNRANALGRGVRAPGPGGLTDFGRRVVREMERLDMVVDASHLSDEALDELVAMAERPVVASHSNARAVCPDDRNLDDARAEAIARTGGLVALTFAGAFVDADPARVSLDRYIDHFERLLAVVGPDHLGLGSDFDGYTDAYGVVMRSCAALPVLTRALLARGHAADTVRKFMGENWLRILG
ncbi:MAG: dipeptidase [Spirochaetia bacterium]|nr:dipeptidase [Spirochaetia bacterium]